MNSRLLKFSHAHRIVGANMAQAHVSRRIDPPPPDWWHLGGAYVSLILGALVIVGLWTFFGGD